jgi:hypothetical protein
LPGLEYGQFWKPRSIRDCSALVKRGRTKNFLSLWGGGVVPNQQSQYSVFHKVMCWQSLTFRLPNVISPLQQEISYTVLLVGWGA